MKAYRAFEGAVEQDVARAVLAIGRQAFPQVLMSMLRRVAKVDHCMVFSFVGERSASCLLNIGDIPIGADLGEAYSGHFYQSDPNRDAIFRQQGEALPIMLPIFAPRMYSSNYRKIFFEDSDIVDKLATAVWFEHTCFYVNFYRISQQGRFNPGPVDQLRRIAPSISAAVARPFRPAALPPPPNPRLALPELFPSHSALHRLTRPDNQCCLPVFF